MSKTVFMTNVNYTLSYQYPMVRGGKQKSSTSQYHWNVKYITFYILQLLHFGVLKREILERHFGNHSKIAIASLCCQGLAIRKQGLISITERGKKIASNSQKFIFDDFECKALYVTVLFCKDNLYQK